MNTFNFACAERVCRLALDALRLASCLQALGWTTPTSVTPPLHFEVIGAGCMQVSTWTDRFGPCRRVVVAADECGFTEAPIMAKTFLLEVPREDVAQFEDLRKDGYEVEIVDTNRQQGLTEYVDIIVTLSAALTPIIAAYLARPRKPTLKRRIVIDGQRRTFENYEADDVEKILDKLDGRD